MMTIIRDIVCDFNEEDDIEICSDDEDVEFDAGSSRSITYASPSSFFRSTKSKFGRDFGHTTSSVMDITDNDLVVGMQFESKQTTVNAIKEFHIKNSFDYVVVEPRPNTYVGRCKYFGAGCQWRIRASLNIFGRLRKLAELILVYLNQSIPVMALVNKVVSRFGYIVTYRKAWIAKQMALTQIYASSQDENRRVVPVAFAIVEAETKEAWEWLFFNLRTYVTNQPNICIISDRGKGLLAALRSELTGWTSAYSVYCIRHIASNFNKEFRDSDLKERVVKMGYELMRPRFERKLNILRQKNSRAGAWLDQTPKEKLSQAYDQGRRYGHMSTNLAECINGVLKGSRALHITALVKATYYRLNE
ncbi:hypothetical protein Lal_00036581 [Lupinus albus]|nr:hypothetical protein Lal_00036581 [Lupinus albus]